MRNVGASLNTHYLGRELTLALCVKITQRDGTVLGFTDFDQDLTVSSVLYRSSVGCQVSSVRFASSIEEDRVVIEGILFSAVYAVQEPVAIVGMLSNAAVDIFEVNWADLSMGTRPIKKGYVAQVSPKGTFYSIEVESLASRLLRNNLVETYNADCNADFGDARCTKVPASYVGTITAITDEVTLVASAFGGPATPGYFSFGKIIINSISWAVNQVKLYNSGSKTFTLAIPLNLVNGAPSIGDTFTVFEGCDLLYSSCRDTHNNVVNFRGFPFIPLSESITTKYPPQPEDGYLAGEG
jgi:uncharacterized phage protein (TIGR02218 family)